MGKDSKIAWTDHTFNPWWGCEKIDPACAHCYADAFAKRTGHKVWGKQSPRRFFGEHHWQQPLKWNAEALKEGRTRRVFCASMADVFEQRDDLMAEREKLWPLIKNTPMLDWLLLTKRPENIRFMLPPSWLDDAPLNVWYGTTVGDQKGLRRVDALLRVPAKIHFISCEPLLEKVVFTEEQLNPIGAGEISCLGVDWIICGGESGHHARNFELDWARSLLKQCRDAGVPFFMKQLGENTDGQRRKDIGDIETFPEELRVREFPQSAGVPC